MKMDSLRRQRLFSAIIFVVLTFLPDVANAQPSLFGTNLVVVRIGDGIQKLSNTGNAFFFDQYTTDGTFVSTVAVPDTGATPAVLSGNSTNDSYLTRSADGRFLTVAIYATNSLTAETSLPVAERRAKSSPLIHLELSNNRPSPRLISPPAGAVLRPTAPTTIGASAQMGEWSTSATFLQKPSSKTQKSTAALSKSSMAVYT